MRGSVQGGRGAWLTERREVWKPSSLSQEVSWRSPPSTERRSFR